MAASSVGALSSIESALAALAGGEMVVVVDDPGRENEGDLVMAAEHVTAEAIDFMATEGRGLICVPMRLDRLRALEVPPMVTRNTDSHGTAFHVGVDLRAETISTGISASDRAATIRALADPRSTADSFDRPGHVFPLASRDGGIRERRGHTEATVELLRLAGRREVGVICEIAGEGGEMMRMPELLRFAERHRLCIVSIAELIAHLDHEGGSVARVAETRVPLPQGKFVMVGFRDLREERSHLAAVTGAVAGGRDVLVHVHAECFAGDVLGSSQCACHRELDFALSSIAEDGAGAIVYLRGPEGNAARFFKQLAHGLADSGSAHGSPPRALHRHLIGERDYSVATDVLRALGIEGITLVGNDHRDRAALQARGLPVNGCVGLAPPARQRPRRRAGTRAISRRLVVGSLSAQRPGAEPKALPSAVEHVAAGAAGQ